MSWLKSIFRSPVALGGVIAAGIVFAVAAAAIVTGGFTQAQETPAATDTPAANETPAATDAPAAAKSELRNDFLDRLAAQLDVSRDALDQAIKDVGLDMVDQAVADGRITEDEAARIREAIENGKLPFFGPPGFHHRPHRGAHVVGEVAEFLGVEPQVVLDGLENGQSLAQVAEANGKSRDELKTFLLDEIEEYTARMVENGRITQERAAEIRENASARIDELIDREGLPFRPFRDGRDGPKPGGLPGGALLDPLGPLL